jgi:hypothetical protein
LPLPLPLRAPLGRRDATGVTDRSAIAAQYRKKRES